jgi:hypothetical protein
MIAMQGMPIIYYGLEQGFNGNCDFSKISVPSASSNAVVQNCKGDDDSLKRQDMFMSGPFRLGSAIPELNQLAFIGKSTSTAAFSWDKDPMLNRNHYLYQLTRKMLFLRNSCTTLARGGAYFRNAGSSIDDWIAFSRVDTIRELVVVINPKPQTLRIQKVLIDKSLHASLSGQTFVDLLNVKNTGTIKIEGGQPYLYLDTIEFASRSISVFTLRSALGTLNSALGVYSCAPISTQ